MWGAGEAGGLVSGNGSTIATPGIIVAMMALGRLLLLWGADIGLQAAAAGYDMASHVYLHVQSCLLCYECGTALQVYADCDAVYQSMSYVLQCHKCWPTMADLYKPLRYAGRAVGCQPTMGSVRVQTAHFCAFSVISS